VTEAPDDLLEPEDSPDPADGAEAEDDQGLSAEESLGQLPSD
jgi:hypothetical protein